MGVVQSLYEFRSMGDYAYAPVRRIPIVTSDGQLEAEANSQEDDGEINNEMIKLTTSPKKKAKKKPTTEAAAAVKQPPTPNSDQRPIYEDLTSRLLPTDLGTAMNWFAQVRVENNGGGGGSDEPRINRIAPYFPSPLMSRWVAAKW